MGTVPYPLTGGTLEELRSQIWEAMRQLYEEKIGGADLGDVFAVPGDVLTLVLDPSVSGLQKTGNQLALLLPSASGLIITTDGLYIKNVSTGGLEVTASGIGIKLDGSTLSLSASGLKVTSSSSEILSTTTGIDAKIVATTNLYTVPVGNTAIVTGAVIRVTVADTVTVSPTLGIGIAAGEDDIISSTLLTGLNLITEFYKFNVEGIAVVGAATEVIKLGIDTGATATTMTISIDLIGYLI